MEKVSKLRKKPITYGKSSKKQGYGKPMELDSEDELASMDKIVSGRISKQGIHSTRTVLKPASAARITTPPMSPSPSITSPASSISTKRASPFPEEGSGGKRKKTRVQSGSSTSSVSDEMFSAAPHRIKKPIPKLSSKKRLVNDTSDATQLLLDNQLQDYLPDVVFPRSSSPEKDSGMKMPSRGREQAMIEGRTQTTAASVPISRPDKKSVKGMQKTKHNGPHAELDLKAQPYKPPQEVERRNRRLDRPRTPEVKTIQEDLAYIFSPSNLELDVLTISSTQPQRTRTPEIPRIISEVHAPPQASPFRAKLKDRLTSDLTDMVTDLDSTMETSLIGAESDSRLRSITPISSQKDGLQGASNSQSSQNMGPKVIYAAARWTFLPDEDDEMGELDSMLDSQDSNSQSKRSRQLPDLNASSSNLDSFNLDDDDDEDSSNKIRSLHELKRAGVNQRILRQAEALLDDIEQSKTKSQRLSTLLELIAKFEQTTFLRQFVDVGSETRFINLIMRMKDTESMLLYSVAMLMMLSSPNISMITFEPEAVRISDFLSRLLDQSQTLTGFVERKSSQIPKDIQRSVKALTTKLASMAPWHNNKSMAPTGRMLGLTSLDCLVRKLREAGNQSELLSSTTTHRLIQILSDWESAKDESSRSAMALTLSVLESASLSLSMSPNQSSTSWSGQDGSRLLQFVTKFQRSINFDQDGDLLSLALRLCLNLSNGEPEICSVFCNSEFIQVTLSSTKSLFEKISTVSMDVSQDLIIDNLVLALGLLINLSEKMEEAQALFMIAPVGQETPLDILLHIFVSRLQGAFEVTSEAEMRSNVPFGYLAVLLGYLCKNDDVFAQVRARLDGGNLRLLLIAIKEFLQYHQKVEELRKIDGETDVKMGFVSRLQGLLNELMAKDSSASARTT